MTTIKFLRKTNISNWQQKTQKMKNISNSQNSLFSGSKKITKFLTNDVKLRNWFTFVTHEKRRKSEQKGISWRKLLRFLKTVNLKVNKSNSYILISVNKFFCKTKLSHWDLLLPNIWHTTTKINHKFRAKIIKNIQVSEKHGCAALKTVSYKKSKIIWSLFSVRMLSNMAMN